MRKLSVPQTDCIDFSVRLVTPLAFFLRYRKTVAMTSNAPYSVYPVCSRHWVFPSQAMYRIWQPSPSALLIGKAALATTDFEWVLSGRAISMTAMTFDPTR